MRSLLYFCGVLGVFAAGAAFDDEDFDPQLLDLESESELQEQQNAPPPVHRPIETKAYVEPRAPTVPPFLVETFQSISDGLGEWKTVSNERFKGKWNVQNRAKDWIVGDKGLSMLDDSSFHGLARKLSREFSSGQVEDLYGTMEVQFEKQHNCGGAYFKLFHTDSLVPSKKEDGQPDISNIESNFDDTTPYSIMFGPDRCGFMVNKVHLIVKYESPAQNGELVEEHLASTIKIPTTDPKASHQYGFAMHSNGAVELYMDGAVVFNGTMKSSFKTNFEAPLTITDTEAKKPADWVEESEIADPTATKPEDWDEEAPMEIVDEDAVMPDGWDETAELMIPNPDAVKPEDWDDAVDGEWIRPKMKNPACLVGCGRWQRPMKANPEYKGKWTAPKIPNPDYKGPWEAPQIPNPNHYDIENPWKIIRDFNAIGFELWTVESGALFDNIFLTTNKADFENFIQETYGYKKDLEHNNFAALVAGPAGDESTESASSEGGVFSRLFSQAQNLTKSQSAPVVALAMGIPIACVGYLLNRFVRRSTTGLMMHKKTDEVEEDEKENKAGAEKSKKAPEEEEEETKETEPTATSTSEVTRRKRAEPSD